MIQPKYNLLQHRSTLSLAIALLIAPCVGAQPAAPEADTPTQPSTSQADAPAEAEQSTSEAVAEQPKTQTLLANEEIMQLTVPAAWKVVKPRNNLIELELSILPTGTSGEGGADENEPRGRLTMMAAGGGVDANIRRWVGQFRLGRDADGKDAMRRDKRKLRHAVAHVLDIAGTYFDSPKGPFGPKVELADYRMLGAIIVVEGAGKYYVKLYGPASIVEENREAFEMMLESLTVVDPPAEASDDEDVETNAPTEESAKQAAKVPAKS